MVSQTIRAVYNNKTLKLLEPLDLQEGQEVQLVILSDKARARMALGDMLVASPEPLEAIDEQALMQEIDEAFRGLSPLSETIIEERDIAP